MICDLNDENKLQVDKNHKKNWKNWNILKIFEKYNIMNFKAIRYKICASGKIVYSILNYKLRRLLSILRLPKN